MIPCELYLYNLVNLLTAGGIGLIVGLVFGYFLGLSEKGDKNNVKPTY